MMWHHPEEDVVIRLPRPSAPIALAALACFAPAGADDPNLCDVAGEEPNLVVADVTSVVRVGAADGTSAYSFGDTHCNLGTCQVDWFHATNRHPVTTQNFYRHEDGAFEQLGQSWVMHAFFALSNSHCTNDCHPTDGTHLGVGCSDVNSAASESQQANLGPRSEIDASKGAFPFPFATRGETGTVLYKRLQVRDAEQDPTAHPTAAFFGEIQMVNPDDAAVGNLADNVAHRRVSVAPATLQWTLSGPSVRAPAIQAWQALDPQVLLAAVDVPGDGAMILGARVSGLGGGLWRYEYALQNRTSHRSARSYRVPLPAGTPVTNVGFHDVDYHSGETYDGTDWPGALDGAALAWSTSSFAEDPDANALRWGTLYNFRFVAPVPPAVGAVTIGLFRPGVPSEVIVETLVPAPCDADGTCEPGETPCDCFADCGAPAAFETACGDGLDDDCNGTVDCNDTACCAVAGCSADDVDGDGHASCDCDDANPSAWLEPGEVAGLRLVADAGATRLEWDTPSVASASVMSFEVLRSTDPVSFHAATCVADAVTTDTTVADDELPAPGAAFHYAVRATNACPDGEGSLGRRSTGVPRPARSCPCTRRGRPRCHRGRRGRQPRPASCSIPGRCPVRRSQPPAASPPSATR
jgi:hypothetical protein